MNDLKTASPAGKHTAEAEEPEALPEAPRFLRSAVTLIAMGLGLLGIYGFQELRGSRISYDTPSVLRAIRSLREAQYAFLKTDADRDGLSDFGSLEELVAAGLVPEPLADGRAFGYRFETGIAEAAEYRFWITAVPERSSDEAFQSFAYHFFANQTPTWIWRSPRPFAADTLLCEPPQGTLQICDLSCEDD